jgi:hypothetical protein
MHSLLRFIAALLLLSLSALPGRAQYTADEILKRASERLRHAKTYQADLTIGFWSSDTGFFRGTAAVYFRSGKSTRHAIKITAGDENTGAYKKVPTGDSVRRITDGETEHWVLGSEGKATGTVTVSRPERIASPERMWLPTADILKNYVLFYSGEERQNGIQMSRIWAFSKETLTSPDSAADFEKARTILEASGESDGQDRLKDALKNVK